MILFTFESYMKNCVNLNTKCKCYSDQTIPLHLITNATFVFEHASADGDERSQDFHVVTMSYVYLITVVGEHIIKYCSLTEVVSLQLVQKT